MPGKSLQAYSKDKRQATEVRCEMTAKLGPVLPRSKREY